MKTYCVYKPTTNEIFEIIQSDNINIVNERIIARGDKNGVIIIGFDKFNLSVKEYQKLCAIECISILMRLNNIEIKDLEDYL